MASLLCTIFILPLTFHDGESQLSALDAARHGIYIVQCTYQEKEQGDQDADLHHISLGFLDGLHLFQ